MAVYRAYQCASCAGKFRWLHHPNDEPPPANCPLCGAATGDVVESFIPQAPAIQGVHAIAGDQVYRAMEASSAARAEMMAEVGGGSASDYAHTKITDLKDNTHEGEVSAVMPSTNEVRAFMQQHGGAAPIGVQANAQARAYATQAHTGYAPYQGLKSQLTVNRVHGSLVGRMAAQGQLNK